MNMFCYQCEQTAKGAGCTAFGVCGKSPNVLKILVDKYNIAPITTVDTDIAEILKDK